MVPREPRAPPPPACLNCGERFGLPRPRYCPACAQETNVRPPSVGEFLQQFGGAYFSTEGALWRTLKLLLTQPGELTRQYLAGRRKHYVLPLRLYLSISVLALLVMRLAVNAGVGFEDPKLLEAMQDKHRSVQVGVSLFARAGVRDGVFYCEHLPRWACDRLRGRIAVEPQAVVRQMHAAGERVAENASAVMFVLVPLFALGLRGLYRNRALTYTEHLVFALHLHAFWFFVFAFMQINWAPIGIAGSVVLPVYTVLAMKRVYGGRWWLLLPRAALLLLLYAFAIGSMVSVAALIALLV